MFTPTMRAVLAGKRSLLLDNLVAYWKLEEASGTRVDATGRGNDLTANNSPGNAAGVQGNALSVVQASSQSLTRAVSSDLLLGDTDYTVTAWLNATQITNNKGVVGNGDGASTWDYQIYIDTSSIRASITRNGAAGAVLTWGTPIVAGTWYFVVMTYTVATRFLRLSVDNGTMLAADNAGAHNQTGTTFSIGRRPQGSSSMAGSIDEVGVWKRILTSAEITALYNSGAGRSHPFSGSPV